MLNYLKGSNTLYPMTCTRSLYEIIYVHSNVYQSFLLDKMFYYNVVVFSKILIGRPQVSLPFKVKFVYTQKCFCMSGTGFMISHTKTFIRQSIIEFLELLAFWTIVFVTTATIVFGSDTVCDHRLPRSLGRVLFPDVNKDLC